MPRRGELLDERYPETLKNYHCACVPLLRVAAGSWARHTSVVRYRANLSVFFAWYVREKLIATNPVTAVRVPKGSAPPVELHPFTEDELEAAHDAWALRDPRLADVMLAWAGPVFAGPRPVSCASVTSWRCPPRPCWYVARPPRASG